MTNWIKQAKWKIEQEARNAAIQKELVASNPVVDKYRRIDGAIESHLYQATVFTVYKSGQVERQVVTLPIGKTNVRMKSDSPKWEQWYQGAGWFTCPSPPAELAS